MRLPHSLLAAVFLASILGVPTITRAENQATLSEPVDFTLSVDAWWASHPLNPQASGKDLELPSPEPVLDVRDFDSNLQRCLDALPPEGGTVRLPPGEYEGGFRIVGRQNIHLIGEGDDGAVIIRGGESHIIGDESNLEYGDFCEAVHRKEAEAMRILRELPARNIVLRNLTFDDCPVRLAACQGILFDRCVFEKAENRDVGDKDAEGKKVLRWYRPLSVTGIMGLRGIWFRDSEFRGHNANAVYLDGAHGSGFLRCRFAGVDRHWHNAVILFTNDDLSLDVNGNDRLEPFERRDISYFIFDGCEFGRGYKRGAIAASGRDILVQNCRVEGPLDSFLVINAKTSGKKIFYESFGVIVRNNTLEKVNAIVTAEGPSNRPEKGIADWWVWTKFDIGRFEIRDNRITGMNEALREEPRDGEIQGPHQIENNGPEAPGARAR